MTLSRDGCYFCKAAETDIRSIAQRLDCAKHNSKSSACNNINDKLAFYARPVVLQHFPTFRKSDAVCEEHDSPKIELYRENWEVLSKAATKFLGENLKPRVAFSGHSHHYCRSYNLWSVEEFTIASFSWRNKPDPSFLLVSQRAFISQKTKKKFNLKTFDKMIFGFYLLFFESRPSLPQMIMRSPNVICPEKLQLSPFMWQAV